MEPLHRFFETKGELNIVLAGYVSDFLAKLMEVHYTELARHILESQQRTSALIQHMADVSVAKQVVYPLLFRGDKCAELDTSVLERKLEREATESALRPLRIKLLKDLWARCSTVDEPEYVVNVLWTFKEAVVTQTKDERAKSFLHETLYSKHLVNGLFEFAMATQVN